MLTETQRAALLVLQGQLDNISSKISRLWADETLDQVRRDQLATLKNTVEIARVHCRVVRREED